MVESLLERGELKDALCGLEILMPQFSNLQNVYVQLAVRVGRVQLTASELALRDCSSEDDINSFTKLVKRAKRFLRLALTRSNLPEHQAEVAEFPQEEDSDEDQVQVGQKLEAQDVKFPSLTCVATVSAVKEDAVGEIWMTVTFDGWDSTYDYTDRVSFVGFHPIGWCRASGKSLQEPGSRLERPSQGWGDPFDWNIYLEATGATPVPATLLTGRTTRHQA